MADRWNKWRTAGACLLLGLVTLGIYWPVTHHDFINFDDTVYLTENHEVMRGLTWEGVKGAFVNLHGVSTYWHPLTWISHMLDCQLFGLNPGPHHLVNVLFHVANAILLFLILRAMTGAFWRSVAVAALFAWHPLQVDTVAWASERKNVLSTLFWLLTISAYVRYVHAPRNAIQKPNGTGSFWSSVFRPMASGSYWLALLCFALGLMCKPVLVTVPFVLLLLDFWPLNRLQGTTSGVSLSGLVRLVCEKTPFFALSAASSAITIIAHLDLGSIMKGEYGIPFSLRVENAVVSYVRYLGKTFWPADLAICYPHPGIWPNEDILGSLAILLAVTGFAIWQMYRRPYVLVGWLWFLGVLVPAIGVIQAGVQGMADRFAYVPLIGLFVAIVWGINDYASHARLPKLATPLVIVVALSACLVRTSVQLAYWKNSVTLFTHAIDVTEKNFTAHTTLGLALSKTGKTNEAIGEFAEAIRINPLCAEALHSMGVSLTRRGDVEEARPYLDSAASLKPQFADITGRLALELAAKGNFADAINYLRDALRRKPDDVELLNNLAWILATGPEAKYRDGSEAVRLAERACELTHYKTPLTIGTLAAAYAESGRFEDAVATAKRAATLAKAAGDYKLAEKNLDLAKQYRSAQPFHEALKPTDVTPP